MVPEERARLIRPRADLHEALEMLGEIGARRALVVEVLRRVLPIYTDWAGADPAVGAAFAATAAALPERVPDKLQPDGSMSLESGGKRVVQHSRAAALVELSRETPSWLRVDSQDLAIRVEGDADRQRPVCLRISSDLA